jgi:hypothetical protein
MTVSRKGLLGSGIRVIREIEWKHQRWMMIDELDNSRKHDNKTKQDKNFPLTLFLIVR